MRQAGNVNIADSPEFSTLSIENLELKDAGNYTCAVSNPAGTVSYTDSLEVKAPPIWLIEPKDTRVTAGQQVTLTCKGGGFPPPATTWTRLGRCDDNKLDNGVNVLSIILHYVYANTSQCREGTHQD